jgi:ectoine hydroxylase-related dioxygenase (phytanoyl-CoA dioxygenase family)
MIDFTAARRALQDDGVAFLPGVLNQASLAQAESLFDWSIAHPTPSACRFYETDTGTFYQDLCNPEAARAYREFLTHSPLADVVAKLWDTPDVWFLYEQLFLKQGTAMRRTPWHQDSPYLALDGKEIVVLWINFDPVDRKGSLEFVRGSHRGTLYDGSAFDPDDDTKPIYAHGLPRLPDIEADRSQWEILSWAVKPGDVVAFHPSILHGGAPTEDGVRRRTLSLRFFGGDAVYARRPEPAPAPLVAGLHESLQPGQLFRHPAFPKLRPIAAGFDEIPRVAGHQEPLRAKIQKADQ